MPINAFLASIPALSWAFVFVVIPSSAWWATDRRAVVRPSRWQQLRVPLAWAATIVLASGLGWYSRSLRTGSSVSVDSVAKAVAQPEARQAPALEGRLSRTRDVESAARAPASPATGAGALADGPARAEADAVRPTAKVAEPALRDAPPPAAVASNGIMATPAAPVVPMRNAAEPLSAAWPVIEPQPARDLLGIAPAAIPGYAVRALRRNPSAEREIVVEQEIANGVVVSLFERPIGEELRARRLDAAKAQADERLARFVGGLRIEISGPLPMDSLSRLLELVSP